MCHFMFLSDIEARWPVMGILVKLAQSVSLSSHWITHLFTNTFILGWTAYAPYRLIELIPKLTYSVRS